MEITGKLHLKYDEVQISEKFKKRDFILFVENERNVDWSDYVKFQLTQDRTDIIDPINAGDIINVHFNVRGREWTKDGKTSYFNTIEAWRIEPVSTAAPKESDLQKTMNEDLGEDETDDLPF